MGTGMFVKLFEDGKRQRTAGHRENLVVAGKLTNPAGDAVNDDAVKIVPGNYASGMTALKSAHSVRTDVIVGVRPVDEKEINLSVKWREIEVRAVARKKMDFGGDRRTGETVTLRGGVTPNAVVVGVIGLQARRHHRVLRQIET